MIKYVTGDATKPIIEHGIRIIAHVCNDLGGWGSGFVVALSDRWDNPEKKYRNWHEVMKDQGGLKLGDIQLAQVRDEHGKIYVANMIAQHGYATFENPVAILNNNGPFNIETRKSSVIFSQSKSFPLCCY